MTIWHKAPPINDMNRFLNFNNKKWRSDMLRDELTKYVEENIEQKQVSYKGDKNYTLNLRDARTKKTAKDIVDDLMKIFMSEFE